MNTRLYSVHEKQAPQTRYHQGEPLHWSHCPHCGALAGKNHVLLAERGHEERTGLYRCECGKTYTHHG